MVEADDDNVDDDNDADKSEVDADDDKVDDNDDDEKSQVDDNIDDDYDDDDDKSEVDAGLPGVLLGQLQGHQASPSCQ